MNAMKQWIHCENKFLLIVMRLCKVKTKITTKSHDLKHNKNGQVMCG